jgi:hypothetical protein
MTGIWGCNRRGNKRGTDGLAFVVFTTVEIIPDLLRRLARAERIVVTVW